MMTCLLVVPTILALTSCEENDITTRPCTDDLPLATVSHYDYSFDIGTNQAASTVSFVFKNEGCCGVVNNKSKLLSDPEILSDTRVSIRKDNEKLEICFDSIQQSLTTFDLKTTQSVKNETVEHSQVGYSHTKTTSGDDFYYLLSWVEGCDAFGPCDPDPKQFATYDFHISHPQNLDVLCPGAITRDVAETHCQFNYNGGPSYSTFSFAAHSNWKKIELGQWGNVNVSIFDVPQLEKSLEFDEPYHRDFFEWMQSLFGPYPYGDELRFAFAPTYWNGFEHPGTLMINQALTPGSVFGGSFYENPLAHTINHEIAHLWAGNQSTLKSRNDFVWKEAVAEYLTFVFDNESGRTTSAQRTNQAWELFSAHADYWPVPNEEPDLFDFYSDVYGPGPMIFFRQIEAMTSRNQVMNALTSLLGKPQSIGVDDLQEALQRETSLDLKDYFAYWVQGEGRPKRPEFIVDAPTNNTTTSSHIVVGTVDSHSAPGAKFDIQFDDSADNTKTMRVNWSQHVDGILKLDTPNDFDLTTYEIDPHHEIINEKPQTGFNPLPWKRSL